MEDLAPEVLILVCDRVSEQGQFSSTVMTVIVQLLQDADWHLKFDWYSRGHQTWSTAVVFGSCFWTGGAQPTGAARWRWLVFTGIRKYNTANIYIHLIWDFWLFVFPSSDDFPESTGVKRIVQALNANVWSSVEMKEGEVKKTHVQLTTACSLAIQYNSIAHISVWKGLIRGLVWWAVWWPPDTTIHDPAKINQSVPSFFSCNHFQLF